MKIEHRYECSSYWRIPFSSPNRRIKKTEMNKIEKPQAVRPSSIESSMFNYSWMKPIYGFGLGNCLLQYYMVNWAECLHTLFSFQLICFGTLVYTHFTPFARTIRFLAFSVIRMPQGFSRLHTNQIQLHHAYLLSNDSHSQKPLIYFIRQSIIDKQPRSTINQFSILSCTPLADFFLSQIVHGIYRT